MTINEFRGDYQFLSNFYVNPLQVGKYRYVSMEHYYQSRKCVLQSDWEAIVAATYPAQAKKIGLKVQLRDDWEEVKLHVMRRGLACKFSLDTRLGERLLDTGNHDLIEGNTWGDTYWGQVDGKGHNWLGHLLMARRAELRGQRVIAVTGPEVDARGRPVRR